MKKSKLNWKDVCIYGCATFPWISVPRMPVPRIPRFPEKILVLKIAITHLICTLHYLICGSFKNDQISPSFDYLSFFAVCHHVTEDYSGTLLNCITFRGNGSFGELSFGDMKLGETTSSTIVHIGMPERLWRYQL